MTQEDYIRIIHKAGKMVQRAKKAVGKPDNLSSILETTMEEGENQLHSHRPPHVHHSMYM